MKSFKKSEFLRRVYDAAGLLNCDTRLRRNPDDAEFEKYLAFMQMVLCDLTEGTHGWIEGKGYSKECPINRAVLFLARTMRMEDMVPMKDAMANAMILLEYSEAAWEEYQVLLTRYEEVKAAVAAGLFFVAEQNAEKAGLRS